MYIGLLDRDYNFFFCFFYYGKIAKKEMIVLSKYSEVDKLYRKSLRIDGFIYLLSFPIVALGTNGIVLLFFNNISDDLRTSIIIITFIIFFLMYVFLRTFTFGNQSIGMRLCSIELVDKSNTLFQKLTMTIWRVIIISMYHPLFGPSFEDYCRQAELKTGTKIVIVKRDD